MEAGAQTSRIYGGVIRLANRVTRTPHTDVASGALAVVPALFTAVTFALLFAQPIATLLRDWWTLPEAGHGMLLAPVAIWLAYKSGIRRDAVANPALGLAMLVLAVLARYAGGLAAELFTMRASILL